MKNDRYGQYEQVNGGVANDLMDKLEATEKITRQLLTALTASRGQWIQSVNAERCLKATEDAAEYFVALKPEEPLTETEALKRKDEWIKQNVHHMTYPDGFDVLWGEFDRVSRLLVRMSNDVLMMLEPKNNSIRPVGMDRAIELLTACSEDLFIEGNDKPLEDAVDKFLNENGKCTANCTECKNCPTSLQKQAD